MTTTTAVRERINIAGVRTRLPWCDVTIWRSIKAGKFPAPHYIGSRRYWFADEVDAWLADQAARSGDAGRKLAAPLLSPANPAT